MRHLLGYTVALWLAWPLLARAHLSSSATNVSTLAGSAEGKGKQHTDGTGTAARFAWPLGIAVAPDGTVYVTDTYQHTIRKITPTGTGTTFASLVVRAWRVAKTAPARPRAASTR